MEYFIFLTKNCKEPTKGMYIALASMQEEKFYSGASILFLVELNKAL